MYNLYERGIESVTCDHCGRESKGAETPLSWHIVTKQEMGTITNYQLCALACFIAKMPELCDGYGSIVVDLRSVKDLMLYIEELQRIVKK